MPHRKRILLSDDNEGFSTLLLESLHEHGGFHVFHAREEHEVMETIQCHKPHILLLDDMLRIRAAFMFSGSCGSTDTGSRRFL